MRYAQRQFVPLSPMERLIKEARYAARFFRIPSTRRVAAREAERIPQTYAERFHNERGQLASHIRAMMRSLPDLPEDRIEETVRDLSSATEILADLNPPRVVSETHYRGRRG